MPVFRMTATAPNGTGRSRPVVAANADEALADWRQEIEIDEKDTRGFVFEVMAVDDPDGRQEQLMVEAEQRELEAAFYRMPAMRAMRSRRRR